MSSPNVDGSQKLPVDTNLGSTSQVSKEATWEGRKVNWISECFDSFIAAIHDFFVYLCCCGCFSTPDVQEEVHKEPAEVKNMEELAEDVKIANEKYEKAQNEFISAQKYVEKAKSEFEQEKGNLDTLAMEAAKHKLESDKLISTLTIEISVLKDSHENWKKDLKDCDVKIEELERQVAETSAEESRLEQEIIRLSRIEAIQKKADNNAEAPEMPVVIDPKVEDAAKVAVLKVEGRKQALEALEARAVADKQAATDDNNAVVKDAEPKPSEVKQVAKVSDEEKAKRRAQMLKTMNVAITPAPTKQNEEDKQIALQAAIDAETVAKNALADADAEVERLNQVLSVGQKAEEAARNLIQDKSKSLAELKQREAELKKIVDACRADCAKLEEEMELAEGETLMLEGEVEEKRAAEKSKADVVKRKQVLERQAFDKYAQLKENEPEKLKLINRKIRKAAGQIRIKEAEYRGKYLEIYGEPYVAPVEEKAIEPINTKLEVIADVFLEVSAMMKKTPRQQDCVINPTLYVTAFYSCLQQKIQQQSRKEGFALITLAVQYSDLVQKELWKLWVEYNTQGNITVEEAQKKFHLGFKNSYFGNDFFLFINQLFPKGTLVFIKKFIFLIEQSAHIPKNIQKTTVSFLLSKMMDFIWNPYWEAMEHNKKIEDAKSNKEKVNASKLEVNEEDVKDPVSDLRPQNNKLSVNSDAKFVRDGTVEEMTDFNWPDTTEDFSNGKMKQLKDITLFFTSRDVEVSKAFFNKRKGEGCWLLDKDHQHEFMDELKPLCLTYLSIDDDEADVATVPMKALSGPENVDQVWQERMDFLNKLFALKKLEEICLPRYAEEWKNIRKLGTFSNEVKDLCGKVILTSNDPTPEQAGDKSKDNGEEVQKSHWMKPLLREAFMGVYHKFVDLECEYNVLEVKDHFKLQFESLGKVLDCVVEIKVDVRKKLKASMALARELNAQLNPGIAFHGANGAGRRYMFTGAY